MASSRMGGAAVSFHVAPVSHAPLFTCSLESSSMAFSEAPWLLQTPRGCSSKKTEHKERYVVFMLHIEDL